MRNVAFLGLAILQEAVGRPCREAADLEALKDVREGGLQQGAVARGVAHGRGGVVQDVRDQQQARDLHGHGRLGQRQRVAQHLHHLQQGRRVRHQQLVLNSALCLALADQQEIVLLSTFTGMGVSGSDSAPLSTSATCRAEELGLPKAPRKGTVLWLQPLRRASLCWAR